MRESSLKYGAAEREVSWGQVPQDPVRGRRWRDLRSSPGITSFSSPSHLTVAFPLQCPTLCPSPPVHIRSPVASTEERDLQGARVVFHTSMDKRCVYHQLEFSGLKLKRGKIKNIISLLPRPISLLCSNISNSQQENHICRGNFWAWLMLFVSSAGQSGAVWQQVSEHNPSGEAERAVNKLWKFNDIQISEWLLKWYSG